MVGRHRIWSPRSARLHSLGIDLYLHQQAIDTTTPAGKALFQMMAVFAEFEREMIRERIDAGLARTKAKGTKLGRRPVAPSVEARIRALRADGMGMLKIGRELGIGTSVVQRVLRSGRNQTLAIRPAMTVAILSVCGPRLTRGMAIHAEPEIPGVLMEPGNGTDQSAGFPFRCAGGIAIYAKGLEIRVAPPPPRGPSHGSFET